MERREGWGNPSLISPRKVARLELGLLGSTREIAVAPNPTRNSFGVLFVSRAGGLTSDALDNPVMHIGPLYNDVIDAVILALCTTCQISLITRNEPPIPTLLA